MIFKTATGFKQLVRIYVYSEMKKKFNKELKIMWEKKYEKTKKNWEKI